AGGSADEASTPVAPDEVPGAQRRPVRQLDVDTGGVLLDVHHVAATHDRNPEVTEDPVGQDRLEAALPEREQVVVPRGEIADVQSDGGVPDRRVSLALGEESLCDA